LVPTMRPPFARPDFMSTLTNAFGKIDIAHCQTPSCGFRTLPALGSEAISFGHRCRAIARILPQGIVIAATRRGSATTLAGWTPSPSSVQKERAGDNPALSPLKRKMVYRLRWSF
jgi:hypothetical protein